MIDDFETLKLEDFIKGIKALPDGYDDPRIDNIVNVITSIIEIAKRSAAVDIDDIREIIANSTEFPEMWEEGYSSW